MRLMQRSRPLLMLACAGLIAGCAQDKKFEGVSVSGSNSDRTAAPYVYNAVGSLDFDGQDPVVKANKVMNAACPAGQPSLMLADAPRIKTETSKRALLIAIFTC